MQQNIFAIRCSKCGSPVDFDIVTQNYHCAACGCDMPAAEVTKAARERSEAFDSEQKVKLSKARNVQSVYSCNSCGANVIMQDNEFVAQCDFCGTSVTKTDFDGAEFPQGVIPFYITKDEALRIFLDWYKKNFPSSNVTKVEKAASSKITGYYLPFQMIRGPIRMNLRVYGKGYTCGGYLEGIFVGQSKIIPNLVLDAAEPFDTSDLVPFDFSYLAGQRALFPDVDSGDFMDRISRELRGVYHNYIVSTFHSEKYHLLPSNNSNLIYNTVFLPMYVFRLSSESKLWFVVNGQTGRVAMGNEAMQEKSNYGFLKRDDEGSLKRDFREFPQYKPKDPLFYENKLENGKTVEKAGIYKAEVPDLFHKGRLDDVMLAFMIFAVIGSMASNWQWNRPGVSQFFMTFVLILIIVVPLGALAYMFWRKRQAYKSPKFEEVTPKYKEGGAGADNERYLNEFASKEKNRKILHVSLLVILGLSIITFVCMYCLTKFSIDGEKFKYYNDETMRKIDRYENYEKVLHKQTLDEDGYLIGFMAKTVSTSKPRSDGRVYSAFAEFTNVDGNLVRVKYENRYFFTPPNLFLVFKRVDNSDFMNEPWNVVYNYNLSPPKGYIGKDCFMLRPGKRRGDFYFCSSTNQVADSLLRVYKSAYGINY